MDYDEDIYDALYWVIVAVCEIALTWAVLRPLEAWRPLERWPDRRPVRADIWYTWIAKLGVVNGLFFVYLQPLFNHAETWMQVHRVWNVNLDEFWPGVSDQPLVSFAIYVVALDFAGYWYHRWQHRFGVWWELHAVHHSQRQMSLWTDDRNHVLDDVVAFIWFLALGLLIGIPPMQFPVIILILRFLEGMSHANARVSFGAIGERLLISPRFHRAHHGILAAGQKSCNYGATFPFWDILFGTADFSRDYAQTGDPSAPAAMVTGRWWQQQVAGFARLGRALTRRQRGAPARAMPAP